MPKTDQKPEASPATPPKPTPDEAAKAAYLDEFEDAREAKAQTPPSPTAPAAGQVIAPSPPPSGAEKPAVGADTQPHLSVYRQLALREGYEDDEVAAMTEAELHRVVRVASRKTASPSQPTARQPEQAAPVASAKPEPEPEIDLGWGEEEVGGTLTKLEDKNYDPGLVRVLKRIVKENGELKRAIQGTIGHLQSQEQNKVFDEIDTLFSGRPELFGTGSRSDIEAGSPEHAKRVAVVQLMDTLAKQHKELGVKSSFKQRHAQAVHALFGGSVAPTGATGEGLPNSAGPPKKAAREKDPDTGLFISDAEAERRQRQEAWVRGGVAQPTQREPDELPPGKKKAVRGAAKHMANNGHVDTIPEDEYDDDVDV